MSSKLEERIEKIIKVLEDLSIDASSGTPVIVEGINDLKALRRLNVKGEIILAKAFGRSLLDVIKEIKSRRVSEVILLLDFDRRGKEWTRLLAGHLESEGIKPNLTYWRELQRLAGKELKDIEGLSACLKTLKRRLRRPVNETL